ncbi:hypothetical protein SAMN05216388_101777 [Halorientalis persicus]|uniref:Uncharacterized protein n=1 Tax=Halorientalis persicus TaxID=1367881 RepID=A0A1H8RY15_9EURY|nr:hypothetical protein [Halorientalis persicus]SEO71260.1 hypothetical protein SAMN05216388_101777 [Halorientalis persicus]
MSLKPGQSHKDDAQHTETRTAAEALSAGDAVALDANGELVTADGTNNPTVYGVVGHDDGDGYAAGDDVLVTYSGPVVANVAAGVGPGVELGASATEGQLAGGTSAKGIMTMYGEGAAPGGIPDIPTGYAHVDV